MSTDPGVLEALRVQLTSWRAELQGGARRIGWKIGFNLPAAREQVGLAGPVIGYLTSATLIDPGGEYVAGDPTRLLAEVEVAVEVTGDGDIARFAPAIELVDVDRGFDELEPLLAENIFHRAYVLGAPRPELPAEPVHAGLLVNGEEHAAAESPDVFAEMVAVAAGLLDELGERLHAGDWIITGAITSPVPVAPGDEVCADLGALGRAELRVT